MTNKRKLIPTILGPLAALLIWSLFSPAALSYAGVSVLAVTIWIAIWWIFEVVDIAVTALLPIVLFPLLGALDIADTTAAYAHKYIFLYMGGFFLAIAIEKWNLHRRIALNIIARVGVSIPRIVLGFMVATAFLSMWISNTATAVMMLPIGMAIVQQLKDHPDTPQNENRIFGKMLMLSIAYSASIGGMATLIGTPPNLVLAGVVNELYDLEITFAQWFIFGFPISVVLLLATWYYLTRIAYRLELEAFPGGKEEVQRLKSELGPMGKEELTVSIVFTFTALLLISRSWISEFVPAIDDTIIAMSAGILVCSLPAKNGKLLEWKEAVKIPWGVLILFGGGMALAAGFTSSGLALYIGNQFNALSGLPVILLVFVVIASTNFLTEVTSNLATTAMLLPILAPIAFSLGVHPYLLLVAATVAASCAFMLPAATPPNAVVFGSGYLRIADMVKTGFILNVLSILLLTIVVFTLLGPAWQIDVSNFPESLIK